MAMIIVLLLLIVAFAIFSDMQIIIKNRKFIPTHKVKLLTNADGLSIRKEASSNSSVLTKIENGTEIQQMSTGEGVKLGDIKGYWCKIRTKDFISGWCFSGSLEKL